MKAFAVGRGGMGGRGGQARRDVSMQGEPAGEGVAGWDEVMGGTGPPDGVWLL